MPRERLAEASVQCCCTLVLIIFGSVVILALAWLGIRVAENPKCSIENFYVPALNKTLDSQLNTSVNFMVRFDNPNEDNSIYYDDVNISVSNINRTTIGNYTVPKFHQGKGMKAKKWGQVLPLNNQVVLQSVLPKGFAVFRLDLETQVRFNVIFWKTKRYSIKVGADVEVNGDGVKAQEKGIKMKKI